MATATKATKLTLQPPKASTQQKSIHAGEMIFEMPKKSKKKAQQEKPIAFDSSSTPSVFLDHSILQRRQRAAAKKSS
ncbi:hypothetical protein Slin15195_G024280 [Septoria linicola]|uniref:Uncharacterized protein n=1 Tax=Septoria linicola TaxID=215465 RepID=A0A9Q9EGN7_9PEZI|nr:hypothetical protein Slin15195_G024280 [Septoria linicola]